MLPLSRIAQGASNLALSLASSLSSASVGQRSTVSFGISEIVLHWMNKAVCDKAKREGYSEAVHILVLRYAVAEGTIDVASQLVEITWL